MVKFLIGEEDINVAVSSLATLQKSLLKFLNFNFGLIVAFQICLLYLLLKI